MGDARQGHHDRRRGGLMRTWDMIVGQYTGAAADSMRSVYQPENGRLVASIGIVLGYAAGLVTDAQIWLIGILLVAAIGDLTSGATAAVRTKTFSRARLIDGGLGRILRLHLVLVGALLDRTILLAVPADSQLSAIWEVALPATTIALVWLIAVELASILKNIERGGQRVPGVLSRGVARLKEKIEGPLEPEQMKRRSTDRPEFPI